MRSPSMSSVRFAFAAVAWLFLACVVVQFFLAGLGVFAGAENFECIGSSATCSAGSP